ncbi:hypothetical protein HG536_0H01420 [Torulaspora globosa]|uniref:Uncharacterized protein n=1 Tax=Torulaspora globosa TaxID=48254 RepID=A0A7G3ZMN1_9SACH|nr:uncharacterized protein HG536_0H01420 [Torulaspora globosa]QLL34767.1 hypothetical protein HG536_0H01420 [Torulaspora globosa]
MGKDDKMVERSASEEEDDLKSEKREKLGKLCASLGLQPSRMTDKMLSTIEMSKDIERNQRDVIKKLSSTSPRVEEDEDEDEDARDGCQSIVVDDDSAEVERDGEMQLNTVGKSLKRKRIPPPLSISETNSTTASLHGSGGGSNVSYRLDGESMYARSAPAHVPKFPRSSVDKRFPTMGKPRVQYLGRVSSGVPRRDSPIQSTNAYKLKTPYLSYFPSYPMPPPVPGPSMAAYAPYHPYGYPGQLPLYQSTPQQMYNAPMVPQWQPRSAVPYSSQARHHQDMITKGKRGRLQNDHQTKKARTKETDERLRDNQSKDADNDSANPPADNEQDQDAENGDDTESAHLAIEDDPRPFPSSEPRDQNIVGEIRISGNVFSYEFPSQRPSIDKKMFMSICDKVWDESTRLLDECSP